MAKLKYRTISRRTVEALAVEDKDAVFWDDKLPARRQGVSTGFEV